MTRPEAGCAGGRPVRPDERAGAAGPRGERSVIMKDLLYKRLANLLTVKSLVTVILTVVFAALTVMGRIEQSYMTIYTVIISFYFGIQTTKMGGGDE